MRSFAAALITVLSATACGSAAPADPSATSSSDASSASSSASSGDGGGMDAPQSFTADEMALLAGLSPADLPLPTADVTNAHADDAAAAALGKKLFFTTAFSGRLLDGDNDGGSHTLGQFGESGKVSCAGCHVPTSDFSDTRSPSAQISLASGWGRRRAPSLLDVGHTKLVMWDGRHDSLYNQVFGPLESAIEMNSSRLFVAEQVFALYKADYQAVFGPLPPLDDIGRFPALSADETGCSMLGADNQCVGATRGSPGDGAEYDGLSISPVDDQEAVTRVVVNVGKALGAYERRLSCGQGRFDSWMHGDQAALSPSEQRGAKVFIGSGKCVSCHSGPFLSDQQFHDVGLSPAIVASAFIDADDHGAALGIAAAIADPLNSKGPFSDGDDGRLIETSPSLEGSFRTPTLRCVSRRPSFLHTGQMRTLEAVIDHFDAGGNVGGFFGTNEIAPLALSAREKSDLEAFLHSLDGPGADASLIAPQ